MLVRACLIRQVGGQRVQERRAGVRRRPHQRVAQPGRDGQGEPGQPVTVAQVPPWPQRHDGAAVPQLGHEQAVPRRT